MRKIFSLCAVLVAAMAMNAAEIQVTPGSGTLREAVESASAGDVLVLSGGDVYSEPEVIDLNKNLTIKAAEGVTPVVAQQYYMKLLNSAQVTIIGIKFDGGAYKNGQGANDHFIRPYDDTADKSLTLIDCEVCNWKSYVLYPQRSNRCMKELTIKNCFFHDNARSAIYTAEATTTLPLAELNIENSTFAGLGADYKAIDVKNLGTETNDVKIRIDHCTFYNYGPVRSEKSTDVIINNSIFAFPTDSAIATTLYAGSVINNCLAYNMYFPEGPTMNDTITADPLFADAANGDFTLGEGSPALGAGTDGSNLGDPRWWPAVPVQKYAITIAATIEHGSVLADKEEAEEGDTITLTITPEADYAFDSISITGVEDSLITMEKDEAGIWTITFPMPAAAVEINAFFSYITPEPKDWCKYPLCHLFEATANPDSYVLLTITDNEDGTISFTLESDTTKNNKLFAYPQINPIGLIVGADVAEGGEATISGTYTIPEGTKTLTLEVLWSNPGWDGRWMVQNLVVDLENDNLCEKEIDEAIDNNAVASKAQKVIENGQLVIIKNGVKYNAQGAMVK